MQALERDKKTITHSQAHRYVTSYLEGSSLTCHKYVVENSSNNTKYKKMSVTTPFAVTSRFAIYHLTLTRQFVYGRSNGVSFYVKGFISSRTISASQRLYFRVKKSTKRKETQWISSMFLSARFTDKIRCTVMRGTSCLESYNFDGWYCC